MDDTPTVELCYVHATADITFADSSITQYIDECVSQRLEPSQDGFLKWCEAVLASYGSSLIEDFDMESDHTTAEHYQLTLRLAS